MILSCAGNKKLNVKVKSLLRRLPFEAQQFIKSKNYFLYFEYYNFYKFIYLGGIILFNFSVILKGKLFMLILE